jgi:gliding motility-associated-like protein
VIIADPAPLYATGSSPLTAAGYNVSNYGANDGSIDVIVQGGTSPYTYTWNNGSSTQDLTGIPAGTYSVQVTDANGCQTGDTITLIQPFELAMPSGFSPNADGYNDYFVVHGIEVFPDNTLEVYNRWGNLVFDAAGYVNQWSGTNENGEALPDGTYFVVLNINNSDIILKGYVDIRR